MGVSDSGRSTAASMLSALLFAVAIGVSNAGAQSDLGATHHGLTCDLGWVSSHYRESPNFTVRVSFREQPISEVKVALTNREPDQAGGYAVATSITDSGGVAHFFAIPPATYQAHVEEGLLAQSAEIVVEAGNTSSDEIRIEWPAAPIVTRSVRGWITSWKKSAPQNRSDRRPLQHVQVQLLDLRSAKMLASKYTSPQGYYEFSGVGDGLYVLRVNEHPDPSINGYDKAVEVRSDATAESMPGLVVDSRYQVLSAWPDASNRERAAVQQDSVRERTK
jgi:hypothetical protein